MTYLVLLGTIFLIGLFLFVAILATASGIRKRAVKKGINTDYYPTRGKVAGVSSFTVFLLCFLSFGLSSLYVQSAGLGLTPHDAFATYTRAIGVSAESYKEVDGGNVTFFISSNDNGQESWVAYERKGVFYSRSYGLPSSYYYYCNVAEDGTYQGLAAAVAEVETEQGYFYFVGTYGEQTRRNEKTESVVFNGKNVTLTDGLMFASGEKLSSFSLEAEKPLSRI